MVCQGVHIDTSSRLGHKSFVDDPPVVPFSGRYADFLGMENLFKKKDAYSETTAYEEAKQKYPFDDKTACADLSTLLTKISSEIDQQRINQNAGLKKDRAIQQSAEKGYSKRKTEIQEQFDKSKCKQQKEDQQTTQDIDTVSNAIRAAQDAARSGAIAAGSSATGNNTIIYILGGVGILGVIGFAFWKLTR